MHIWRQNLVVAVHGVCSVIREIFYLRRLGFSSWKIDIMSKTTTMSWKIIYFDFSGLLSCVDCRNQYVMLGVNSFKETTFAFDVLVLRRVKVHQNCFGHNISHIYFIFAFFRGVLMLCFNKNTIERKLFWWLSIMRELMNQWILMANFNTSGYIDMETRFMYLSHSVFFFSYIFVTSCVETFVSNIVHCSELRNLMVELSS